MLLLILALIKILSDFIMKIAAFLILSAGIGARVFEVLRRLSFQAILLWLVDFCELWLLFPLDFLTMEFGLFLDITMLHKLI